jgi:hypothetical protein
MCDLKMGKYCRGLAAQLALQRLRSEVQQPSYHRQMQHCLEATWTKLARLRLTQQTTS